jgi:hypothetical protein
VQKQSALDVAADLLAARLSRVVSVFRKTPDQFVSGTNKKNELSHIPPNVLNSYRTESSELAINLLYKHVSSSFVSLSFD